MSGSKATADPTCLHKREQVTVQLTRHQAAIVAEQVYFYFPAAARHYAVLVTEPAERVTFDRPRGEIVELAASLYEGAGRRMWRPDSFEGCGTRDAVRAQGRAMLAAADALHAAAGTDD